MKVTDLLPCQLCWVNKFTCTLANCSFRDVLVTSLCGDLHSNMIWCEGMDALSGRPVS